MKQLAFLILALLLPVSLMANDRVVELNVTGQPPLNTNERMGFMDEVAKEALRRIGYQLKTLRLPAERGLVNSNRGVIDGEMSRVKGIDKNYKNLIRVPEKIMDWEFVGFSYQPLNLKYGWRDLSGKSVAHINGWKIFEINVPNTVEVSRTNNAKSLFNLLKRKRTDIVLYERWGGHFILHEMNMRDVKMCKHPLAVKEMFIYLHKKNKALVPLLAESIAKMKKDGSYQDLFNKFLMPYSDHAESVHESHI